MVIDYYVIRKQKLLVEELYEENGSYWFSLGFNWNAIVALVIGIIPNIPGFMMTTGAVSSSAFPSFLGTLYHYAWFVGFAVSGAAYFLLTSMRLQRWSLVADEA